MDRSPFAPILDDLVLRVGGSEAVALVDLGGETVDYAGSASPYDIKVAAAHWRIILAQLAEVPRLGRPRVLLVRSSKKSVIVRALPDDYALVVLLVRRSGFMASNRALSHCEKALAREAGWELDPHETSWFAVSVECDARRRPTRIVYGGLEEPVDVLGAVVGLSRRETGFRVRLASGPEITLIREAGSFWYVEESG
jgi:hypothetical protein